ncbi:delta(3,5)-Delta(2,4)-dienoyl-CoA isomerase [Kwoniella heveanensis BCC8398]|uniref:Delta(3,5)-Delta(2,4)-dienoyl-CoA isomerase n=1 Tax=Kwoniella heveanensis BCC8398 TaxID=1296120 RepID=A0A1B9GR10_9TREE|nr:delta(3,5)-Delta(2,4)-dienoyl-CoA isomerase [Kwoniella heveanensis BCC8398]
MWKELRAIVHAISSDPNVRAVVLSSALEKTFTAGLDLNAQIELKQPALDPARKALQLRDHVLDFQDAISSLEQCRQPIVCALFGTSVGLAVDIASACDVRLAADDTTFGILEVNVGLAADIGTLQRFPKIVGNESLARELALTGRKFDAKEALDIGFVSKVVPGGRKGVIDAAVETTKTIASKSPVAVISTKHLMNRRIACLAEDDGADGPSFTLVTSCGVRLTDARDHSVEEGLRYTAIWNASMLQSTDTVAAMKGVMEKRAPKFAPISSSRAKL